jgi:hypothetical protein
MTLQMIGLLPVVALNQTPLDGQLRGLTALHIVSGGRDIEDRRHLVIAALVNAKADIEARDLNGRTPLLVAAGAAYWKGAETLHESGADMKATKPGGRNFADEAKDANRALASWWSDISGLQPSGAPREPRIGIFRRGEVSDKRYARLVLDRARRSRMQSASEVRRAEIHADSFHTWGSYAWGGGDGGRDWSGAVEAAERGSCHGPLNVDAVPNWKDSHSVGAQSNPGVWLESWTDARPGSGPGDRDRYRDRRRPESGPGVSRRDRDLEPEHDRRDRRQGDRDRGYGGRRGNGGWRGYSN